MLSYNLYAYCANNPVIYYDPTGEALTLALAAAGAGSYAAGAGAAGGANFWNPVGWVLLGTAVVGGGIWAGVKIYQSSKSKPSKPKKQSKKTGKEKASDAPDWAKRQKYNPKKSADENAKKVLKDKYGNDWAKRGKEEFSQIKKWLQRSKGFK